MPGPVLVSQLISVFVFKEIKDCSFTVSTLAKNAAITAPPLEAFCKQAQAVHGHSI